MAIDRRRFLELMAGGAALSALPAVRAADAPATAAAASGDIPVQAGAGGYLAARRRDGRYEAARIDARGRDLQVIALPDRGHSFALDPERGRAVAFGRQPGFYAVAFGLAEGAAAQQALPLPPDRHFFGHGCFSADGRLLYATENDFEGGRGMIGVYDASDGGGWNRVGEFDGAGIGPHETLLMPDGKTLCIANGGILTHPDYGKLELNLDSMSPSLAYLDLADGRLLEQVQLPPELHRLSIRHLCLDRHGAVWFGCQYMGPAADRPMLVGRHRRGRALEMFCAAPDLHRALRNYIGSVACDAAGEVIATSSPVGGLVLYWDAASGRCLGGTPLADGCGVAAHGRGRFLVNDGHGSMIEAGPDGPVSPLLPATPGLEWDNHLRKLLPS